MKKMKFFIMAAIFGGLLMSCGSKTEKTEEEYGDYNVEEQAEPTQYEEAMISDEDVTPQDNTTESVDEAAEVSEIPNDNAQFTAYIKEFKDELSDLSSNIKKATDGDVAAIAKLSSTVSKLEDLEKKIKSMKDLTVDQKTLAEGLYKELADKASEVKELAKNKGSKTLDKAKEAGSDALDKIKNLGK